MERALDPNDLLVGVRGKDALRDAFDAIVANGGPNVDAEIFSLIEKFGAIRGLRDLPVDPVIDLLEAGGVARNRAAREIMKHMVELMIQKIGSLNQDQLAELLDRSYSYLTVPELAPVAIKTLENLKNVRPALWSEIVENGLNESPYTGLPLSIKRRIWRQERSAFEHELDTVIARTPELQAPSLASLIERSNAEVRKLNNKPLKDLQQITQGMGENNCLIVAESLYQKASTEQSVPRMMAIANLFHDFIQNVQCRGGTQLYQARRLGRALDKPPQQPLDQALLREIRDALAMTTQYPLLMLLTASTYTRDYITETLLARLGLLASKLRLTNERHQPDALKGLSRDPDLLNLTYLCLFTMKVRAILAGTDFVQDAEVESQISTLFPLIMQEMANDQKWAEDEFHRENAQLPNNELQDLCTQSRLARRVLSTYCVQLFVRKNVVGARRFHLLLDKMIPLLDPVEEIREITLVRGLCSQLMKK